MKLKIALLLTILAIGLHTYLTFHHYQLNFGVPSGESVCNINEKFNCDAVAASKYSAVFGVPVALWGAVTNGILAVLLVGMIIGWTDNMSRLNRYTLWLSGLIAGASVIMGSISVIFLSVFCLFCIATYILSFGTFALLWSDRDEQTMTPQEDISALFGEARFYLGLLIAIPVVVLFFHLSATRQPETAAITRQAKLFAQQWQASPTVATFDQAPLLTSGAPGSNAKMIITEFADFLCPHCKDASPVLKTFVKTRPDVELHFFAFPLEKVPEKALNSQTCTRCELAKATGCANEQNEKGWAMHDAIFGAQYEIATMNADKVAAKIEEFATNLGINPETLKTCMKSEAAHERLKAIVAMAEKAGVQSTPTVFVNGKKLTAGQLMPVLEAVHQTIK